MSKRGCVSKHQSGHLGSCVICGASCGNDLQNKDFIFVAVALFCFFAICLTQESDFYLNFLFIWTSSFFLNRACACGIQGLPCLK